MLLRQRVQEGQAWSEKARPHRSYHYFHAAISKSNIHGKKSLDLGFGCSYGSSHQMSGYFTRATEMLECPRVVVDDHSEEMKGGQVLFSTARLQFSRKVLEKLYQMGHDELSIERLLQHI